MQRVPRTRKRTPTANTKQVELRGSSYRRVLAERSLLRPYKLRLVRPCGAQLAYSLAG